MGLWFQTFFFSKNHILLKTKDLITVICCLLRGWNEPLEGEWGHSVNTAKVWENRIEKTFVRLGSRRMDSYQRMCVEILQEPPDSGMRNGGVHRGSWRIFFFSFFILLFFLRERERLDFCVKEIILFNLIGWTRRQHYYWILLQTRKLQSLSH